MLKHLREAEKDINKAFVVIRRKNMELYPQAKAKNPDEWVTVSLSDAAKMASDYRPESWPTFSRRTNISWAALSNSCGSCKPTDLRSCTTCVPQNHVVALQRVVEMARRRSPELDIFIEKARVLIINSREKAKKS